MINGIYISRQCVDLLIDQFSSTPQSLCPSDSDIDEDEPLLRQVYLQKNSQALIQLFFKFSFHFDLQFVEKCIFMAQPSPKLTEFKQQWNSH